MLKASWMAQLVIGMLLSAAGFAEDDSTQKGELPLNWLSKAVESALISSTIGN